MNHAHTDIHADWADSLSDWAAENAQELRHFTGIPQTHRALPLPAERQWVAPQGHPAWPARRCSVEPTMPLEAASSCTEIGAEPEDQSEGADGVFWVYMATIGAVIAAAALAALA